MAGSSSVLDVRDAAAKSLYGRLFAWVVNKVNQLLASPAQSAQTSEIGTAGTPASWGHAPCVFASPGDHVITIIMQTSSSVCTQLKITDNCRVKLILNTTKYHKKN